MCVEVQDGIEGRVVDDFYAAVAGREEQMCAGPVEDALVRLDRLALL